MKLVDISNTKSKASATSSQVVLLAAITLRLLITLTITIFLGRILLPSDYGFFALVNTIFIVARGLLDLGTSNVAARESILNPSQEREILESLMGWQRALGAILALIVFSIALSQDDPQRKLALGSAAVVLYFMYINALYPTFQVRQAHGWPAVLTVGTQLFLFIGSICLFLLKAFGALFVLLIVLRESINLAGIRALAMKLLGYRPRPRFHGKKIKIFYGKALTYGLATLMYNLYFHCGMFFLWFMQKNEELGAFAAAFRPIAPLLSLPWALLVPLVPILAQAAAQDRILFNKLVKDILCLSVGIGAIGAVSGSFMATNLITLLYGGNYASGELSAVNSFQWFSLALCFGYISPVLAIALLADCKEKKLLVLSTIGLLFNLVANLLLIPKIGFPAVAMITAITELIVCLGVIIFSRDIMKSLFSNLRIFIFLIPAGIICLAFPFFPTQDLLRVLCGSAAAILGILLLLASPAARQHRRDIALIKQTL